MHNEFMAFITDEETLATVRAWAERQGFPADSVQSGGADHLIATLKSEAPPKLTFVDMDGQLQPSQTAGRLAGLCDPAAKMVALGSENDVGLYRDMIAAGMTDYLLKPITSETLTQAMVLATRGRPAATGTKETKIIVIVGLRGGVGASTVAINTSWLIGHELKRKCAMLDLDLQFGTSALALDVEPGHGFREIVSSPQRVDSLMVSGAMVNESEYLSVMSAEEPVDEIVHVDNSAILMLLKEVRSNYRVIVIDLPRHMLATQKRLFALAHEIVLVTEMSLVGIRDTLRVRTALKTLGTTARVTLVAARVGPQRSGSVDETTFAKGAQVKIDFFLPDDPKNVMAASNAGKTLGEIAAGVPLTKGLLDLARHLVESEGQGADKKGGSSKGLLSGLFKRGKQAPDGDS